MAGSSPAMTKSLSRGQNSIHLFVDVDAPEPLLLDPAVEAIAHDVAPAAGAVSDLGDDAGLQARVDGTGRICPFVQRGEVVLVLHGDDRGAAARQQRVIDPALGTFGIANPAPVFEFGRNLHREARSGVDPGHVVVLGRTCADIYM